MSRTALGALAASALLLLVAVTAAASALLVDGAPAGLRVVLGLGAAWGAGVAAASVRAALRPPG